MVRYTPETYTDAIKGFARYQSRDYLYLALTEEMLEFFAALTKTTLDVEAINKELGDVMWNVHMIVYEHKIGHQVFYINYDGTADSHTVQHTLLEWTGDIAKHVRKNGSLLLVSDTDTFEVLLERHIANIMKVCMEAAYQRTRAFVDYSIYDYLNKVLGMNVEKLTARAANNTIVGKGDNR